MRVLHYIDSLCLEEGGIVRAVLDLAAEVARAGAQVTILTGDPKDVPTSWSSDPAAPRVVTIPVSPGAAFRPGSLTPTIRDAVGGADVVHFHELWDPFNLVVARAARRASKPHVISAHGMLDDWCMAGKSLKKSTYLRLFAVGLLRRAQWVHFTASIEAEQSLSRVPGLTPIVEPLVLDVEPYHTAVGPAPAKTAYPQAFVDDGLPRLLFVGRLHPIKGLPTLLEAIALLPTVQRPHLLLAGPAADGHDAQLQRQAASLGVHDRLHLLGMVGGEVKRSLYEAADAFVLPSHHENFGIALAEAMLCGAPVLTSRSVNIWPEVEKLGGIVADNTAEGFAKGLCQLLDDLPARHQAASMNRPAVFEWLEPKRLATQYLEAYERAISRTRC